MAGAVALHTPTALVAVVQGRTRVLVWISHVATPPTHPSTAFTANLCNFTFRVSVEMLSWTEEVNTQVSFRLHSFGGCQI